MPNPKITIEPVDLSRQTILQPRVCELELGDDRFEYRLKFRAKEPEGEDEGLPWIEVDSDFHFVFKKSQFAGLEKNWHQQEKRWKIRLYFNGISPDLLLFFKRQKDCETVFDQLVEYFFA